MQLGASIGLALYSVEITRFSSENEYSRAKRKLCTLLKLQGSQAYLEPEEDWARLCTLLKLQGSQAR